MLGFVACKALSMLTAAMLVSGLAVAPETTGFPVIQHAGENFAPTAAGPSALPSSHRFVFPANEAACDAAVAAFDEARLTPPDFSAVFHTSAEACRGHGGLHRIADDGVSLAHVCVYYALPSLRERARANTLLHELAHAWIAQNVGPRQIDHFMRVRGFAVWNEMWVPWEEHGAEHAAEILLWGATGGRRHINVRIGVTDPDLLLPAYQALTAPQPAA